MIAMLSVQPAAHRHDCFVPAPSRRPALRAAASLRHHDASSSSSSIGRRGPQQREPASSQQPAAAAAPATTAAGAAALSLGASSSRGASSSSGSVGSAPRLRVAVDVDEVLGRFLHSLNQFCREEYGMSYDVADYHVYDFAKIWECSQDHSNNLVHEFFESRHFAGGIEAIPGAYDSLLRLTACCDLEVVTSRQHVIQQPTRDWLDRHYPQVFSQVHFGNHFALEGASRKKSEICRAIGAHVLVDDNPAYAVECAEAGISVLLYDWEHGYPWSKTADGPSHNRITRVRNWAEAEQVLGVLAAQHGAA